MNRIRAVLVGLTAFLVSAVGAPRTALAVDGQDVSAKAEVTFSPLKFVKKGGLYQTTATLRNASDAMVAVDDRPDSFARDAMRMRGVAVW